MSPTMSENPKQPPSTSTSVSAETTPAPPNHHPPRRSRPRVREVSSRFMSPATSAKSPVVPKPVPSTPFDPHSSKLYSLRRSQTDLRPRYGDENRPESLNRSSVSPLRSSKPRSAVKLFKTDTPAPAPVAGKFLRSDTPTTAAGKVIRSDTPAPATVAGKVLRHRSWDTAAAKLIQATTSEDNDGDREEGDREDVGSIDGDCESVRSEPCENGYNASGRVSTPCSRSMEMGLMMKGGGNEAGLMMRGSVKVARSLHLPPMAPVGNGGKGQGGGEVKKAVRKGSSQQEDGHRVRMLQNHYLQWRFANARAEACMRAQKEKSEKLLYSLGVKIAELQDSVKGKRVEYRHLKEIKTLSAILEAQMPYLDEWSILEDSYSSSLLELSQGLLNVLSQLPLDGNVKADVKEIEDALHSALKVTEMICLQVQSFMPKAENVDSVISDLARVYSGEITLVEECGDLLTKTHVSQVEECSLRGQVMQFHQCNLDRLKEEQS